MEFVLVFSLTFFVLFSVVSIALDRAFRYFNEVAVTLSSQLAELETCFFGEMTEKKSVQEFRILAFQIFSACNLGNV